MDKNDERLLAEFEMRMKQLMYLCDALRDENVRLKGELSQKDTMIEALTSEVDGLKAKYDNLKFAKSFASGNEDEMVQAKKRLSKLVRDVDKCIAMLKV